MDGIIQQSPLEISDLAPGDDIQSLNGLFANRYDVLQALGKGSQGAVYLAKDIRTGQKVAIKSLHIASVKDWKKYDLFHREADTLKRIDVKGVAKLIEVAEFLDVAEPRACIVQEYIEGEALQNFIAKGHRFQIDQIGDILLQLLSILIKLHRALPPVIHRDIKPSNILLNYVENSRYPEVHLIDFGAVANPQVKGGGSTVVGTYGYMAPEQLMGRASAASDIYSLAIVAVYLLSGVPPEALEIKDYRVLIDPHLQHLPHEITAFLRYMLEPRVEERMTDYGQIRAFFSALKEQNYDAIPKTDVVLAHGEYALNKVYSYHQPGNIALWQELPDSLPRMHVEKIICPLNIREIVASHRNEAIVYACISVFVFLFMTVALYVIIPNIGFYSLLISFVLSIFPMVGFISESIKRYRHENPYYAWQEFISSARKSMATVIRIEYCSAMPSVNEKDIMEGDYVEFEPKWNITYAFNPPDDDSPDDLIRSFETHAEPDFQEGDLIPILYRILKDEHGKDSVWSAPYPVAVCDRFLPTEEV